MELTLNFMNGDLLMFSLKSFHRNRQKRSLLQENIHTQWKNTKTIVSQAQRKYRRNIV